jgi:hypothetical protein
MGVTKMGISSKLKSFSGKSFTRLAIFALAFVTLISGKAQASFFDGLTQEGFLMSAPFRGASLVKTDKSQTSIGGFKPAEFRKFLLVATGPQIVTGNYTTVSSFISSIGDDQCTIKNSPFVPQDFPGRKAQFEELSRTVNSCLRTRVYDFGPTRGRPARNQRFCTLEKTADGGFLVNGGLCFFEVTPGSEFKISYEWNPTCLQPSSLQAQGINPQDFRVFSGFYLSGDASGQSLDLTPLGANTLRMLIEPSEKHLPISVDFGNTNGRWPIVTRSDVHFVEPRILMPEGIDHSVEQGILVKNTCTGQSWNGFLAGSCDFPFALGAQMTIGELLPNGEEIVMDYWFGGGVAPSQWDGIVPTLRRTKTLKLEIGKRYRITADMSYPDQYYRMFRKGFNQLLIDNSLLDGSLGQAGLGSVPSLTPIKGTRVLADLGVIPGLPALGLANDTSEIIYGVLESLNALLGFEGWPPFYEKWCNGGNCRGLLANDNSLKMTSEFTITGVDGGGVATLSDLRITRSSNLWPTYDRKFASGQGPSFQCEF